MTQEQFDEFKKTFGVQAAEEMKRLADDVEKKLNTAFEEKTKGLITEEKFQAYKSEIEKTDLAQINSKLATMEAAQKEQGTVIASKLEKAKPNSKSLEQFITEQLPAMKTLKDSGQGILQFTGSELKAAGVTTIGTSIEDMTTPPGSPYLPGIGGTDLEIFDIARNPNFIVNHVDLGRTTQSRLAWINETEYLGAPEEVEEGEVKPLLQHKFKVDFSTAKKIAGHVKVTDEFEADAPQLATRVRRMIQDDVIRGWDDAIQVAIINASTPYRVDELQGNVQAPNYWDAALAMLAQVRYKNFIPNTLAINPLTNVVMKTWKDTENRYLLPPFVDEINSYMVQANKVVTGNALAGDLKQFKVDVYKEFMLKIGWVNDDLIRNQFTIVGEIRYHRYISDARKAAIVYDSLADVVDQLTGTQGS